jgi:hypothetical protein
MATARNFKVETTPAPYSLVFWNGVVTDIRKKHATFVKVISLQYVKDMVDSWNMYLVLRAMAIRNEWLELRISSLVQKLNMYTWKKICTEHYY